MLGSALSIAWHDAKETFKNAAEKEEHRKKFEDALEQGLFPLDFQESAVEYWERRSDFSAAMGKYTQLNQKIQKKVLELTLHAIYYDLDISREMERIRAEKGYMPRAIVEGLVSLLRNRLIKEVNPYVISEADVGKLDEGMKHQFHPANFHESHKGTMWGMAGNDLDHAHFLRNDIERMIVLVDSYINKMKAKADEQERKIKSGEVDSLNNEEDYTHFFSLDGGR